jgi:hypothetical protein
MGGASGVGEGGLGRTWGEEGLKGWWEIGCEVSPAIATRASVLRQQEDSHVC